MLNLIVYICRCKNDFITLIVHLAQKSKQVIKMFAIHPFPFLSQCLREHFGEVWTHAMGDVANVTWYVISYLEIMLIITPKPGYGMAVTPTT